MDVLLEPDAGPSGRGDEKALDFLAEFGFNFVRIPSDYRFWTRVRLLAPGRGRFQFVDHYLEACQSRDFQLSLEYAPRAGILH